MTTAAVQPMKPIQVRHYGEAGPLLVLLHGGPGAPGSMAPLARNLCSRFRVLEPLQRTSGSIPLTVERHVTDLYAVLRDSLEEGPLTIIGFSWGAMLALTYAARFPVECRRVILIGCGTLDEGSRKAYQRQMLQRTDSESQRRIRQLEGKLLVERDPECRNALFAELGAIYTRIQSFKALSAGTEAALFDEAGFNETWDDVLALQKSGIQPAEFAHILAPVIMIHGDHDPHPGRMIYHSLKPYIRDLQYREIPRCGHMPWVEEEARHRFYKLLSNELGQESSSV